MVSKMDGLIDQSEIDGRALSSARLLLKPFDTRNEVIDVAL